jgi:hypothetical protein
MTVNGRCRRPAINAEGADAGRVDAGATDRFEWWLSLTVELGRILFGHSWARVVDLGFLKSPGQQIPFDVIYSALARSFQINADQVVLQH